MADFLLSVGVDVGLSYDQMQKDISDLVTQLNQNPQRVRVGLEIDHSAIERFRTEVANIHNSMGGLGRVTVSPVDTGGLNNAIDGIARLAQSTQGAISTVQTMRAELNSVNAERIQQAIASINGISEEGASALAHSLGEANVRATEVRARLLEAADAEQQLVALQVRGTNEAGHMVNYLMTYNTETGEIIRRMVDITARLEDATSAESHRATTVREITDLYRQMHALMRTNANAANTASYAELANQAQLLQDALALARTESISVDEALTRLGSTGATAINGARDAMSAFRLEMEQAGTSGTVSMQQMYSVVAQMQTLLNNNTNYAQLPAYTALYNQVTLFAQALQLASTNGMTLDAALTQVGLNASTALGDARTAMSAFKMEMSNARAAQDQQTVSLRQVLDSYRQMLALMRTNANASTTSTFATLSTQAELFGQALQIAEQEAISIDIALQRVGLDAGTAIESARTAMSAFRTEMEQTGSSGSVNLTTMYNTVAQMQNLINNNAGYANLATYTNLQTQVNLLAQAIELASNGGMTLEAALTAVGLNGSTAVQNAREAMSAFRAEMSGATSEEERLTMGTANYQTALDKINKLLRQVRANTEKWTAAKTGKSSADYQVYADQARELENLAQRLSTGTITMREFNVEYSRIRSTASGAETSIKAAGEATQTWTQRVGKLTEKFGTWFSITRVIMAAYRVVREMVSAVIDLDTAMTELKKVTNETDATYEKFLVNATKRAKTLGAELADTVSATADFARLGFGIADAEKLADAAIVYKNVGDGIEDIGTASSSIIATMQAFSIPAEEVMKIVDKFNEVGNNYAISSKGIGDALLRCAAAMNAANNSLDETIALAAAANTIIQDPEKVGTTLKTVSMYLRAAKTEAEEAGESTEGMANSVSELRDELLRLTGNKVDIQIDEKTFKSTYQILQELSQVWGELSDISKANILEMVGGKRNSNVVAALLENFTVAENAMKTSAESAGSALAENEKVLESIQGKLNIMKAEFQAFAQGLIGSGLVKVVVDLGTYIMSTLNGVIDLVDALGGFKTVLLSVAAALLIAKGGLIAYKIQMLAIVAIEKLEIFFTGLKNAILNIVNIIPNAILRWRAYAAGVIQANEAVQASIPVIGLVLAAIAALVAGFTLLSDNSEEAAETLEETDLKTLRSEFEALSNTIEQVADSYRDLKDSSEEVIPRFVKLAAGVDKFGRNVSLTDKEYEEFLSLNNKIAEMFPEINLGMDSNGNAMLALSYSADTLTASLEALVKAQRAAATQQIADTMPDVIDNITKTNKEYKKQINNAEERKKVIKDVYDTWQKYEGRITGSSPDGFLDVEYAEAVADMYELLTGKSVSLTYYKWDEPWYSFDEELVETTAEDAEVAWIDSYSEVVGYFSEASDDIMNQAVEVMLAGQDKIINDFGNRIIASWKRINPVVSAWLQTDFLYNELGDGMQKVATAMVSGLDFASLGLKTSEEVQDYIQNAILLPMYNAYPEVKEAFDTLFAKLESGDITPEEFQTQMSALFTNLLDGMDDATADKFEKIFIDGFNQAGIAGTDYTTVVKNLCEAWSIMYSDANKVARAVAGVTDALAGVQKLSTGLNQLDKIYADVFDGEDFDFGAILNNDNFQEAFGGLGEAYTNFIQTIANSPDDISACQEAFNALAGAYIINSGALNNVTDATRDATIAMLEQQGIANAAAIVDAQLAYNKERLKYTTGDYSDATYDEILQLYNECEAGSVTQQVLAELAITKMLTNENGIKTASDIDQLIALANSANATTESLNNLAQAKTLMSQAETYKAASDKAKQAGDEYNYQKNLNSFLSYLSQAQELLNKPLEYNEIDPSKFKVDYTGGSSARSTKSGSSSKNEESWFEKQYKLHKHLVAMEQETEADYLKWLNGAYQQAYDEGVIELNDYYKYQEEVFEGLRDLFMDGLSDIEHEISMRENYDGESDKIISLYKKLMSDVEKEIAAARAHGLDDTDDYIQELQKKWQGYYDSVTDIRESAEEDAKDAIEGLVDYRIDMIKQEIEDEKDALDKKLDYLKDFYDKQKEMLQDQYDEEKYLEEQAEKRKSVSDLRAEIAMLENDDSAWAQKRKLELQEELAAAEDDLGDFEDEHALDLALDALDDAYNAQEAQIEAEMDALEEKLNDPEALYNQALSDIREYSGKLYDEMLEYNRRYGTGNDEDVNEMWEEAYKQLFEYFDINGEWYKGIELPNSTGYSPDAGSWGESSIAGTSAHLSSLEEKGVINSPDYWMQHSGDVPWLTTLIQALNENTGSDVTGNYTDVNSAIDALYAAGIINSPDYWKNACKQLAWLDTFIISATNHLKVPGYGVGTRNATAGIHAVDELGAEYLFTSADGSRYRVFSGGEKVLNAKATDFLYEFANGGGEILEKIIKSAFGTSLFDGIKPAVVHNDITVGGVTVQGNADTRTVSEIRRAQRDNLTEMLKSLNKLNK